MNHLENLEKCRRRVIDAAVALTKPTLGVVDYEKADLDLSAEWVELKKAVGDLLEAKKQKEE